MTRRPLALACGTVLLAGGGAALAAAGLDGRQPPPSLAAPPAAVTAPPAARPASRPPSPAAQAAPDRVIIPSIGVNAAVVPEGTDSSGALQMPSLTARNVAAWWDGGAAPGQDGPAVIAGHVDSAQAGPLVFWRLRLLKPGDTVETEPGNLRFTVTAVTQVPKSAFPAASVYGATPGPELRLITCGGTFDPATGHYLSNVIVYAVEAAA